MAPGQSQWHYGPCPNHVRYPQGMLLTWVKVPVCVLSHFDCVRLFSTLRTITCQAPLSMGILQTRILEWVAMPSSNPHLLHPRCLCSWGPGGVVSSPASPLDTSLDPSFPPSDSPPPRRMCSQKAPFHPLPLLLCLTDWPEQMCHRHASPRRARLRFLTGSCQPETGMTLLVLTWLVVAAPSSGTSWGRLGSGGR